MSLSASSSASERPTASAGRASGSATMRNSMMRLRAERARHLDHARALRQEHRARGDVDIGIEHERHHEDRAGQRADFGNQYSAALPADDRCAQGRSAPGRPHRRSRRRRRPRCRSARRAAAASSQASASRPGKRCAVTSQAAPMPMTPATRRDAAEQQRGVAQRLRAARWRRDAARSRRRPRRAMRDEGDERRQHERGVSASTAPKDQSGASLKRRRRKERSAGFCGHGRRASERHRRWAPPKGEAAGSAATCQLSKPTLSTSWLAALR